MSSWSPENSVITNLGNSLLANARLGLGAIKITRVVARENFEENISQAKQYTLADITSASIAQTGYVVDMKVTSYPDPEEEVETSLLTVRFTNEDLASASATYNLRQIIVLAQLINPNTQETIGDEVPYMVSQCDDEDDCDVMPAREINPTSFDYNLYIIHSGVESVTIEIRTTGYVFESEYNADKTEIWAAINSLESGSVGQGTNGITFETWSPVYNKNHTSWSSEETGETELGVESAERFNDYSENHNIVTGLYSSAFGHNTEVLGGYSSAFGDNNYVGSDSLYSFVAGRYNSILSGTDNTVFGKFNEIKSGSSNTILGGSCCVEDSEYTEVNGFGINTNKVSRSIICGIQSDVKGVSDSIISVFSSTVGENTSNTITGSVVVGYSIDMQHKLDDSLVVGYDIQSTADLSESLIVGRGISVASGIYAVGHTLTATGSCLNTFITGSINTVNASQSSHISGSGNTISSSYTSHVSGYSNTLSSSPKTSVSGWLNQVTGGKCNTVSGHNNKLNNSEGTDVFGVSNTVTDCNNSTVRGGGNTATSSNTLSVFGGANKANMGDDYSVVGGYNNTVSHSKRSIIGGYSLNVDYSNDSVNVGRNNSIYGTKQNYSNIISGDNNTVHNDGGFGNTEIGKTLIVGSNNNVADYINCVIGGDSNSLANVSGSSIIGKSNVVSVFSNQSRSFGTRNCDISGQSNSVTQFESSVITGKNNSLSDYKPNGVAGEWGNSCHSVVSGESNLIQGLYSSTVCGTSNTVSNVHDSFIAGRGNSVSGGNTPISNSTNSIIVVGSLNTVNNTQSAQAVFGTSNTVSAGNTFTSGSNLINSSALATVLGKFNEEDNENTYAVIVGGGTDSANRSNIAALDWSGGFHSNSIYTSQIYKSDGTPFDFGGGTNYIAEGSEIGSLLLNDVNSTVSGEFSLSAGYNNRVAADNSVAIGQGNTLNNTSNDAIVIGNSNSVTLAPYSIIGGKQNTVNFAPENILLSYQSNMTGGVQYSTIISGVQNEIAKNNNNNNNFADMRFSAIIGGVLNRINIEDSQVEEDNVAVPQSGSVILGGSNLRTPAPNCIVGGAYNAFDNLSTAALIIGNGTSSSRHNALVVDTSGNIYCNGSNKSINQILTEKADLDSDGLIPISQIPPVSFSECKTVADDTARFALTTDDVQNGDTVYVNATKIMYFVIDDTKLNLEAGYKPLAAGTAAQAVADKNGNDITTTYQPKIDSSHKLDGNLVGPLTDYTESQTGGQAISPTDTLNEALGKVEKRVSDNENNISSEQAKTTGMTAGGTDYITVNGIRVYVSATAPTGARAGDLWIGG